MDNLTTNRMYNRPPPTLPGNSPNNTTSSNHHHHGPSSTSGNISTNSNNPISSSPPPPRRVIPSSGPPLAASGGSTNSTNTTNTTNTNGNRGGPPVTSPTPPLTRRTPLDSNPYASVAGQHQSPPMHPPQPPQQPLPQPSPLQQPYRKPRPLNPQQQLRQQRQQRYLAQPPPPQQHHQSHPQNQDTPPPESPMLPIPPAKKKQRGTNPAITSTTTNTTGTLSLQDQIRKQTDAAIERRRAELRKLQEENSRAFQGRSSSTSSDKQSDLISRARNMTATMKLRHKQRIDMALSTASSTSSKTPTVANTSTAGVHSVAASAAAASSLTNPSEFHTTPPSTTNHVSSRDPPPLQSETAGSSSDHNALPPPSSSSTHDPNTAPSALPAVSTSPAPLSLQTNPPVSSPSPPHNHQQPYSNVHHTAHNRPSPPSTRGFPTTSVEIHTVSPSRDVSVYGDDDSASALGAFLPTAFSPPPTIEARSKTALAVVAAANAVATEKGTTTTRMTKSTNTAPSAVDLGDEKGKEGGMDPSTKNGGSETDLGDGAVNAKRNILSNLRDAAFSPPAKNTTTIVATTATNNKDINLANDVSPLGTSLVPSESAPTPTTLTTTNVSTNGHKQNREESSQLRLIKDLNRVTEEKQNAMQTISGLESKVSELAATLAKKEKEIGKHKLKLIEPTLVNGTANNHRNNHHYHHRTYDRNTSALQKLLQIANDEGSAAALHWAKLQANLPPTRATSSSPPRDHESVDGTECDVSTTASIRSLRGRRSTRSSDPANNNHNHNRNHNQQRRRGQRRMKSPEPVGRRSGRRGGGDLPRLDKEVCPLSNLEVAARAVETVEDVYSSAVARYYLRKPHGGDETMDCALTTPPRENGEDEEDDGYDNDNDSTSTPPLIRWHQPVESYLAHATVKDEGTLEVIAFIRSDSSVLRLYDRDSISHGTRKIDPDGTVRGYDWHKTVVNVEESDNVLGKVMYIDENGDEGEYWLDSVYEEAVKMRETYCGKVISAAQALMVNHAKEGAKGEKTPSPIRSLGGVGRGVGGGAGSPRHGGDVRPMAGPKRTTDMPPISRPAVMDACVGTEDLSPFVEAVPSPPTSVPQQPTPKPKPTQQPSREKPMEEEEEEDPASSSDALSNFIVFFFSAIYSLVVFTTIRLPLKVVWWMTVVMVVYTVFVLGWIYLADDNGAMALGSGVDYNFYPAYMRDSFAD